MNKAIFEITKVDGPSGRILLKLNWAEFRRKKKRIVRITN